MIHSATPSRAARALLRPALRHSLLALAALAGFSASIAQAQDADGKASPPKILPNERVGSGGVFVTGSGRQFPNLLAFAALRADGSIAAWGHSSSGGSGAPTGTGFTAVYSTGSAFAALKADGSIAAWGNSSSGGSGAPTGTGFTAVYSNGTAFAALKADGSITAWGNSSSGGSGAPAGTDFTAVYSSEYAFAALKKDGSITAWGEANSGGSGAPAGTGFTAVYSTQFAFAALKTDGSIKAWGGANGGGSGAPAGNGFTAVYSTETAFAALKSDGSITAWGAAIYGGSGAPTGTGFTAVYSTRYAFAALKSDGSITAWGEASYGGSYAPTGTGFTAVYSNPYAFAARKAGGSIKAWGNSSTGGSGAPTGDGFTAVYSTEYAFAALKKDGSITAWGDSSYGGSGAPAGTDYRIQSVFYYPSGPGLSPTLGSLTASSAVIGGNVADDGGETLAERGVVYAETLSNADPELGGTGVIQLVEDPAGTLGDYSFSLSGLPGNTAYSFRAYVTDADGETYYSDLEVFSTNLAPVITSNGGGSSAVVSLVENNTVATTVLASDGDLPAQTLSYRIAGGADAAEFRINASSGVLEFVTAPDFETAGDVGADNRYELTVEVSDNGNFIKSATQALTIQVTNLAEPALVNAATVSGLAITGATLGGTVVNDGGSGTITERGVVYALTSQNSNPQIGGSGVTKLTVAGTTGTFSRGLSGLTASSAYTFTVYATNANGTVYSSAVNFTTLGTNAAPGIFYDIPAVLRPSVAVSYAPVQIGSAVPDGPYLQVTNFAGSGTAGETDATGTSATFKQPTGATVDAAGNVYVADNGNHKIRKITPQGVVTTLAGDGYEFFYVGRLKNANGTAASFNYPTDLAVDPAAQFLYVADKLNDVIRRVSLTSPYPVTTFAGSGTGGMLDSATASTARFSDPEGIAVDPTGTYLYVADRKNHRIRQITIATAAVTTLAGSGSAGTADHANPLSATFDEPTGIAVDAAGHVYVTDFGGNKVRKIAVTAGVAGAVTSLGGSATFSGPYGVDVDGAGNVYVTEQTGHLIRMISASGSVSTLAGVSGTAGSSEGIGLAATFNQPSGITIHPNGVAYITHYDNAATGNKIRKINLAGYRLTGSLPAGLSFNAATGAISGSPIGLQAASAFSVSVFNYTGSGNTALSVAVGLEPVFPAADTLVLEVGGFAASGVLGALQLGFVPGPKQLLTLVNNTGSSLVSGTFTGLPEGAVLTTTVAGDTFYFKISYKGGTGNDITLTRSAGPGQVDAPFESGAFPPYLALRTVSALATNSATVSATFKPNGLMTTVHVEYGLTTDYGSSVPVTPANPSNTTEQVVSAVLGGLAQGSNYFYRFTATNVDGTTVTPGGNFYTRSVPVEIPATTRLASGTTLDIDIQVANQVVKVVCVGQVYTFTLSGGATNTWAGSAAGTSASGATLTVTPGSTYNTIHITDSAAGAAVTFNTSGNNFYADQFNVTLNDSPGAVTFNGSSAFSGSNGLNILTTRNIAFASGSSLSLIDGNLSLDANTQTPATSMTVSGIEINGATVQTIGSGSTTLRARGGTGAAASFLNKGIAILSGGSLVGGTTGTMIIEGRGFAGVNGPIQGQGVFVSGRHSTTLAVSTITSGGADVSVTGYGAENTDPAIANAACNEGVAVGNAASASGTWYGKITSGGDGAVTVTGYGGTVVAPASASSIHCSGVYVLGSDAMITSGGAGKVTVSGTAGGPASNSQYCMGVGLFGTTNGGILGGPGASVEVIGRGSEVAGSGCSYNYGVSVMLGRIKAGVGAGTTRVTGYGGGTGAADTGEGISLAGRNGVATYPSITSDGSGSVTVIGHGANASGNVNRGIDLSAWASISSGGGDVRVEGNGGGMGTSPTNFGLNLTTGSYITAGGMGNVTVIGRGGSNLSATAGGTNHGVNVDSGGINQTPGYITSSGGSVTVEGYGGGGSADFLSASSSSTNYGVFVNQGGYITAGGSGAVSITGQGGNLSPGASGSTNVGVLVSSANGTSGNLYSYITSGGGAVTVNGTGGGSQTAAGSSGSNHGVQVKIGGTITAGGTGTVSVTGTGGNPSATGNGATNHGVNVDGTTTLARITSNNGNVTVTGTGGSQGSGASNHGIYLNAGGKVSSDGSAATVSLSGTGGNSSSSGNHGVFVTGGTSPNFSTVTSGGGPVSISGNGGGRASSSSTCGVNVTSGALVTSGGGAGPVTIVGRGGMGSGSSNHGVSVATGGAAVTSGGADLSITGHEGSAGTACVALAIGSGGTVTTASNGGALSLSGNSFTLAGAVSAGSSGTVNLMPLSSGVAMNLGLATDPIGGPVAFSSTELNQVTAATINLGSTTAGNVTVSQPIAFPAGANVHVITAAGASLTPSGSGTDVTMGSGKVLDLSTISTLNLAINGTTADSGYQRLVLADSLNLTGKSLKLSGTYMPAAGNGFTIVSAAGLSGTFDGLPNGAEVVFNGIPLRIGYTATSVTLTATPVSAPPVFAGYAVTAKTGKTAAISPAKILARASDPDGGTVTLTRVFGPSAQGGTVSLTGTVNYTPAPSFTGPDSFDIELTGSGGGTLRATISVTVTADAAAGLNQTGLKLRDGMVDLTFRGIPGRVYTIQRSTNLATWTTLATVTAAADGKIIFTDPSPPQPSGYYRARY